MYRDLCVAGPAGYMTLKQLLCVVWVGAQCERGQAAVAVYIDLCVAGPADSSVFQDKT